LIAIAEASPAFFTAVTRVDSAGLAEAAVATGAVAIPLKLPAPDFGTDEQAGPKSMAAAAPEPAAAGAAAGERREPGQPIGDPADRQHADQRGERDQQHQDSGDQCFFVVRPEVRDRELLDRDGRQVDRGLSDRDDRSALRAGDRGRELGHA